MKQTAVFLCTLLLFCITSIAQNTSYSANTVPVGGTYSTAFGPLALHVNTGGYNTASGYAGLYNNTSGTGNTATGSFSLYSNTTGKYNTATGQSSMLVNTTGQANTANGFYSLFSNSTGSYNTASGYYALYTNSNGGYNTAYGYQANYNNNGGSYNTATGYQALYNNSNNSENTANGYQALYSNIYGSQNVAIGSRALYSNTGGLYNVAVGAYTLRQNLNGMYNTACGQQALGASNPGSYNTGLGFASDVGDSAINATAIGMNAWAGASNQVKIGNTSVTSIGGQVGWTIFSDARVKSNLKDDVPGLAFISLLKPVTYNYNIAKENELLGIKNDTLQWPAKKNIEKMKFSGFIAQEVDAAAQKIGYDFSGVDKNGAIMGLRYADFIVPAIKAIQEQQARIDALEKIIASGPVTSTTMELSDKNAAALNQNMPNPFTKQTVISFSVPLNASSAQLVFYDATGRLISTHAITDRGRGLITVAANDLSSGVYSYTLVIDGRVEGTKQLIKQ